MSNGTQSGKLKGNCTKGNIALFAKPASTHVWKINGCKYLPCDDFEIDFDLNIRKSECFK